MKRLFSKKSGFTLVEIVIALAIFAIMASMIAQMLNLAIRRRRSNVDFEKNLQNQQETLITTKDSNKKFDETKTNDGTLDLKFGEDGTQLTINYQLRSADGTVGDKSGVNYFVGNMDYNGSTSGSVTETDPTEDPDDPNNAVGPQTARFDTRIIGTKGINYIQVNSVTKVSDKEYTIEVTADDSTVQKDKKDFAQFTMFFGKESEGLKIKSYSVNGNPDGLTVRKSGERGMKIAVTEKNKSLNQTVKFTVEFEETPAEDITPNSFGSNVMGGKYTPYTVSTATKTYIYDNLYGAFAKPENDDPVAPAT